MAEERRLPPDDEPDQTRAHEPDQTRAHEPDETRAHEPDETRAHEEDQTRDDEPDHTRDDEPDHTRAHEEDQTRAHELAPGESADPWASGDETTMLPPTGGDRWSGRAGVRPGQPPEGRPPAAYPPHALPPQASPPEEYADQDGGRWWAPAAVALIAFLLLGVLGVGVWLILRATERPAVPPPPPPSPTGSTVSASAAPSPTGTPSPTPSPVATIAVPPVVGLPLDDAKEVLDRNGLKYQVVERPDGNFRPNTVVAVAPAPGTQVPVGSTVTLHVAVAPPPTALPTTARPTATPSG